MGRKVVGIVGSYRKGGAVDRLVGAVLEGARERGAETEKIYLLDRQLEFCRNCRTCTQSPGIDPGRCVHDDDMRDLLARCAQADALVLGAPVNLYNVNALTRRFMERLACMAYWPWGQGGPAMRIKTPGKKAVLIATGAMPGVMGRLLTGAMRALRVTARALGAKPVSTMFVGMVAQRERPVLSRRALSRARAAGLKLG
jgi:multimeric flavodoxin WrbA